LRILCFDIGGTGVKAMLLDESGVRLSDRIRVPTPQPATPAAVLAVLREISVMDQIHKKFDRISAGFPGVVKGGKTIDAPNLDKGWKNFPLQDTLQKELGVPARVANDADIQGLGASQGTGTELTITLGTGVGTALVYEGTLIPNLKLGHQPFRKGETYEEQLGKAALDEIGKTRWNARVQKMIEILKTIFTGDRIFIGGGNAKRIDVKLPEYVHLISNDCGLLGGVKLWNPHARVRGTELKAA
jgi:polyphosphate glucokinase